MAKPEATPTKKGGWKGLLLVGAIALLAGVAGFAVPVFVLGPGQHLMGHSEEDDKQPGSKTLNISFGEVTVNLYEERLTRYLRVKILLVVDVAQEKQATRLLDKNKAVLKNWLIGHLCDKSIQDVSGTAGVNRLRREIRDQFNNLLYPDGSDRIRDVLFEEFVVQ